jgi:hypothetical protein
MQRPLLRTALAAQAPDCGARQALLLGVRFVAGE